MSNQEGICWYCRKYDAFAFISENACSIYTGFTSSIFLVSDVNGNTLFDDSYPFDLQDAPVMTEDMHEERLHAAEVCGDAFVSS